MQTKITAALSHCGIPSSISLDPETTLIDLFEQAVGEFGPNSAYTSLGHTLNYKELGQLARRFAIYLQQHTVLQPGDRIAIQLPNLIQYPVVLYGALLAGLVVVNVNPLYSARELQHQLEDSGAKAIVVLANIAANLEKVLPHTSIQYVIVTELADLHPWPKRWLINLTAKYIKKLVPRLTLHQVLKLPQALAFAEGTEQLQPVEVTSDQLAVLQYTGGTTGVAKGAMLTHANLVSNVLQSKAMFASYGFEQQKETLISPLPLYHIYSFTIGMLMLVNGCHSVLVPNPRDINSLIDAMKNYPMTGFCGINTLFVSLCHKAEFRQLNFSRLKMTLAGGMAMTVDAAKNWHEITRCEIYQGYGLTETSPVVAVNPGGANQVETIGLVVPSTEIKLVDDKGNQVAEGERGELCVRGPQVMAGYWRRPEATAEVIDEDGFFRTGDIALMQEDGYLRIVDRKKDMIIVSGFNVFPNELEHVLTEHPAVVECAAIGVPDEKSGEVVKMFVVARQNVAEKELRDFCKERLTAYKVPRYFEFRDELPKSTVGKILRRELR